MAVTWETYDEIFMLNILLISIVCVLNPYREAQALPEKPN